MSTEDRSKPPDGMHLESSFGRVAYSETCVEAHCEVSYDGDPSEAAAIAAAWAFIDRIRQEAAAAERERLAAVLDVDAAPVEWGCEHPVSLENVAAWLRNGGREP